MSSDLWKDKTLVALRCVFAGCLIALIVVLILLMVRSSERKKALQNVSKNVVEVVYSPKGSQ